MALEQFKTQVLLLHSQQSTLDVLSTGFGERYAVHVATSGTEALNTLGETPIHVIVSAQDLPGMSGLEALREAKKRSPETIGILLAGNDRDDGLEALVDDKEVFQIVRGTVTPEALRNLIDTATKQIRLLAISESANDQAANVDEPAGEHIVMETSENGATLISDGTGRLPVLKSQTVRISPDAGGRNVDVLVLTKDEEFLATIKESSRGLHNVHSANTPAQAEAIVRNHKVGVLVTDAAMVGSNIEAVTEKLRKDVPALVAIVAGRRDDGELLMDLINRGQVYRFLLKPVSPGRARLAIEASVKRHLDGADTASSGKKRSSSTPAEASKTPAAPGKSEPAAAPKAAAEEPRQETESTSTDEESETDVRASGRFTETVSGLAASVRLSGAYDTKSSAAGSGTADDGSAGRFLNPKVLSVGGTAVAAIAAAVWWFGFSNTPAPEPAPIPVEETAQTTTAAPSPTVVETDIPVQAPAVVDMPEPWESKLDEARAARDAGALIAPPEENAIELFLAARAMAPNEPVIATELEAVVNQTLSLAETALLEQRTADAAAALQMARLANPENPRLPFLDAQVAELQLRSELNEARAAIREGRFEDAATALVAAEALAGDDQTDVTVLAQELASARSEQQVDEVLALANQRVSEDALTLPSNDNARYYYELVLSTDPGNTAALQGLTVVANKLVMRSREAIDAGQLDDAELLLKDAAELDPGSNELTASLQALATARADEEALRQAELQKQAAAEQAAKAALAGAAAADATGAGAEGTTARTFGTGGDASSYGASGAASPENGEAGGSSATDMAANTGAASNEADASSADDSGTYAGEFVPISSLTRTNYVVPEYPRSARRRNITGWVDVSFTVNTRGTVENIGILNSNPGDTFNESAREAISEWRFEPPVENGRRVTKRVAVRLSFNLK